MDRYFRWFGQPGSFVLTILMSLYAILLAVVFPSVPRWLCAVAMLLSSVGDIVLMNYRNLGRYLPMGTFPVGTAAFMISHMVYACAFGVLIARYGKDYMNVGLVAGWVITLGIIAWFLNKIITQPKGTALSLVLLCLAYALVIGLNFTTVCSYAWSLGGWHFLAAAGILIFFISDVFIGLRMLCSFDKYEPYIWWLYPIGQLMLLTFA